MPAESIFTRRPITSLLFITFLISILIILILEVILRLTPYKVLIEIGQGAFPAMFITDEKAGFDLAKNYKDGSHSTIETKYSVHTNNISCFDSNTEINKKHNIIVGDSFTWGIAPLEKKWTTILEKNTGQRIVKCGVPAYGPKQSLLKLKKTVKKIGKSPKTIIFAYYWNDLNDDYMNLASTVFEGYLINRIQSFNYSTGDIKYFSQKELADTYQQYKKHGNSDYQSLSTFEKFKYWVKRNSIIANLTYNFINTPDPSKIEETIEGKTAQYKTYLSKMSVKEYPWLEQAWSQHLGNIEEMINYAESVNSKFMMIIIPNKDHVYPSAATKESLINLEQSRKRLKTFLEEKNVLYLDLFDGFSKAAESRNNLYLSNDLHFTIKGEALAGKLVSDFVKSNSFIKNKSQ